MSNHYEWVPENILFWAVWRSLLQLVLIEGIQEGQAAHVEVQRLCPEDYASVRVECGDF